MQPMRDGAEKVCSDALTLPLLEHVNVLQLGGARNTLRRPGSVQVSIGLTAEAERCVHFWRRRLQLLLGDACQTGLSSSAIRTTGGPPVEISMAWATVAWPPAEAIAVCNDSIESKYNSATR